MFGPGVFITVDRGAMFQGSGSVDGFQRYIGKRFVYTGELWKQLHCRSFHVECTITSTGQVIDVSVKMPAADANGNMVDAPQAVTDQINILCREMPKWIPAVVKGRNVSSRFFTTISVVDELQDVESYGNDEFRLYGKYCPTEARNGSNGLKILLVGELAYNPDRIVALEEAGHKLYGLWAKPRFCYSTVGPLPFGHVTDIPYEHWREQVEEIKPDIIYALLSTSAIDIVHEVVTARTGIPLVWHFKEGPHEAMKAGLWDKLMEIYAHADGNVFINSEMRDWIDLFCPVKDKPWLLLDGDLPKKECFKDNFSPLLSAGSGEVHTVVAGRLIGVSPFEYKVLAANGVHIHLYNENNLADKRYFRQFFEIDDSHFHIHRHCTQEQWVSEFSQYDAGWLHCIESSNGGDLMRASWADLNIPARINTMVAACVPMIQRENCGNVFAQQRYVEKYAMGITCKNVGDLVMKLRDRQHLSEIRERIWAVRPLFTFDSHVAELTAFFQDVINKHKIMYGHKI